MKNNKNKLHKAEKDYDNEKNRYCQLCLRLPKKRNHYTRYNMNIT